MADLTQNILLQCKDLQGGVKKLYLLPFKKWLRSQITINNMIVTQIPSSDYYLFESYGDFGISEQMQEDEGGKFFNISFSIKIPNYINIGNFLNQEFRAVGLDRNGNNKIYGLWYGLECVSIEHNTGGSKNEYNGLTLKFEGKEIMEAPYINSINDLDTNYLLQENSDYILQENLGKILTK